MGRLRVGPTVGALTKTQKQGRPMTRYQFVAQSYMAGGNHVARGRNTPPALLQLNREA